MLPHTIVQKYLRVLDYSVFGFLVVIFHLADRFGNVFYQPDGEIEARFGISKSSIKKARKLLKQLGFINYKRGFKLKNFARATIYEFLPDQKLRTELRISDRQKRTDINNKRQLKKT